MQAFMTELGDELLMLQLPQILKNWHHQLAIFLLAGLLWWTGLPTGAVQAAGYYQAKDHHIEVVQPYYATKERKVIIETEPIKPYYSTKHRKTEKVIIKTPGAVDNTLEGGKQVEDLNS
jgi:hypothetical protein